MRNKIAFLLAGVLMATALTACNGQSTEATSDASTGTSSDDAAATSSSDGAQTQTISALQNLENLETMALAEINPEEFVTLGEYKGVTVELAAPNVTDEQVERFKKLKPEKIIVFGGTGAVTTQAAYQAAAAAA